MHGPGVDPLQVKLLHSGQRFRSFPLVENGIEPAVPDGIEHIAMQIAQHLLFILIAAGGAGSCRDPGTIRNGMLPDTTPTYENLRLQQLLAFPGFALYVIDGVFVTDIGVKTKDHEIQALPGPVVIVRRQVVPDETAVKTST